MDARYELAVKQWAALKLNVPAEEITEVLFHAEDVGCITCGQWPEPILQVKISDRARREVMLAGTPPGQFISEVVAIMEDA